LLYRVIVSGVGCLAYRQRRADLAQRPFDQRHALLVGQASDGVVDLNAAPLKVAVVLMLQPLFRCRLWS
jgi:hypothetical protein